MKVTRKHFKIFKRECWKWIRRFGLVDFEWIFVRDSKNEARASFGNNREASIAKVWLARKWEHEFPPTRRNLDKVAMHEVFEVLLVNLRNMAAERYSSDTVDMEIHRVIRVMENVFFE